MKIENIKNALNKTQNYFDGFWNSPVYIEEKIFYEFLMMQSFIQLQLPPSILSDFWTSINTDLVIKLGEDEFYKYGMNRDSKFREYTPLYDILAKTPCFRSGSTPNSPIEFDAIQDFCGTVFNYVESGYVSSRDAKIHLELAEKCLQTMKLHLVHLSKGM